MGLAENIKRIRKLKRWSQADLAQMTGSHTSHMNRIEKGRYKPSIDVLIRIAEALEVSIDFLVSETEQDFKEVRIQNKNLIQRVKLIETLDQEDQQALIRVIDSMLTKRKILSLVTSGNISAEPASVSS